MLRETLELRILSELEDIRFALSRTYRSLVREDLMPPDKAAEKWRQMAAFAARLAIQIASLERQNKALRRQLRNLNAGVGDMIRKMAE
jgi:hypothetical protein